MFHSLLWAASEESREKEISASLNRNPGLPISVHFFRLSASWGVAGRQRWREELKFRQSSYLSQSDSCACQSRPSSFPPFSHPFQQPFQLCHIPWVSCSLSEEDSNFYFTKKIQCFPPPPDVVQPLFPFTTNLSTVSLHCLQIPYSWFAYSLE